MDRAARLNQIVRGIDHLLYVAKMPSNAYFVYRKKDVLSLTSYGSRAVDPDKYGDRYIVALTHNWQPYGKPVDWGVEPILKQIRSMDAWSRDIYREALDQRERDERDKERSNSNEFRAIAADVRQDFAKATNDITVRSE